MRPDIGAIVRDEDGHVAEELDAMSVAFGLQVLPLTEELVLEEGMKLDSRRELFPPTSHGCRLTKCDVAFPVGPRRTAVGLSKRHEQRIIVEPFRLTLAKGREFVALGLGGRALKRLEGFPQSALFEIADCVILHSMRRKWQRICEITRRQQTLCLQCL